MAKAVPRTALFQTILYICLFFAGGLGIGSLLGRLSKGSALPQADPLWLLALPLVLLAVIFWHEAGHALGGALVGFRLLLLTAGPLRIDRQGESWKLSFNRSLSLWGGVAATAPDPDRAPGLSQLPQRMLWMVAGGPLASLFGGSLALLGAWVSDSPPARLLLVTFGFTSLGIALATSLPQSFGGFKSDGRRILELLRGGPDALRWCALASLSALSMKQRPREWPASLVEQATALDVESNDATSALWLRHSWHLDRREIPEARSWLEKALAVVDCWPPPARPLLYSCAVAFYSIEEQDAERAARYFALAQGPGFLPPHGKALTEAAFACLHKDFARLSEASQRGKLLAAQQPGSAGEALREYFERIEARATQN